MKHMTKAALLAAGATIFVPTPRAVAHARVKADSDPKALITQLNAAFETFKEKNEEALKAKADDSVLKEQLGKIEASMSGIEKSLDEHATKIAAAAMGGVIGDIPPTDPGYVADFKAHMRSGDVQASLKKAPDSDGGFLAPVEWNRTITGKLKQVSPIRQNARVVTISGAGFKKLFTDRVIGSGWTGETAARPETTTPTIASLDFTPGEIFAMPAASQQLLDDAAVDLEAWLADEVDIEFARQENIAFLSGDGVNKPFGILTYVTGAANAAKHPWGAIPVVSSGAAGALTSDGILNLIYDLPAEFEADAKLYINRNSAGAVRKLKDGQNNYLWQPAFAANQPSTLAGVPIVDVPAMPAIAANAIAALYGDMDATYLVVDRIGIRVLRDPYMNKPFVMFYTTKRVGGGVFNPEPMRALKIQV